MPYADDAAHAMLDALAALVTHISLHSAYSATGANELAGGAPAYARQAVAWGAAAARSAAMTGTEQFDVPAGSDVAFVGLWSAAAAGTFYGMVPNGGTVREAFTAAATDTLTVPDHGFADNDTVVVFPAAGEALPTGLTAGTVYFVINATADTLQLSATQGGAAVDLTTDGVGVIVSIAVESFAAQGTHTVSSASLGLDP